MATEQQVQGFAFFEGMYADEANYAKMMRTFDDLAMDPTKPECQSLLQKVAQSMWTGVSYIEALIESFPDALSGGEHTISCGPTPYSFCVGTRQTRTYARRPCRQSCYGQ